jgi:glutamate-1-semialdehyde 2,1-aminomutase
MQTHGIPLQAANMSSVWTLFYKQPSRYNWMLQYYLRIHGLALSWVGTGRLIFSLNYSDTDFEAVVNRFVLAATQMKNDGWWWHAPEITNKKIRRSILKETLFRA